MVFESFWDLYLLKSKAAEVTPKKLQNWIKKIKLVVNESTGIPAYKRKIVDPEPDADDFEQTEAVPPYNQISAIVRILIEKRKPEPVENDDGVLEEQEIPECDWEEVPIDDKCLQVQTCNEEGQCIFVINHAAGRMVRLELIKELQLHCDALASIELDEFKDLMEKEAMEFEY